MNKLNTKEIKWNVVILCLLAFIFARVGIKETFFTIGVSYIGALFKTKELRKWPPILAALGVLSLMQFNIGTIKYVFVLFCIIVIRHFMEQTGKEYNFVNQMIVVASSLVVGDTVVLFITGINLYGIIIAVIEALVGMSLTYLFFCSSEVIRENRQTPLTSKESISMILMVSVLLGGMVDFYIRVPYFKEIYVRDIFTYVILISMTYLGGPNVGVMMSVVVSSLLVLIGYIDPALVAVYGFSTLIGGVFGPLGRAGIIGGGFIGQLLGFTIFNQERIDMSLVGAYGIAALISLVLPKSYFGIAHWFTEKSKEENEQLHLERIQRLLTERLKLIVSGFEKLGDHFIKVGDKKKSLTPKDIKRVIEDTGEKMCEECSMRNFCWNKDIHTTYGEIYKMIDIFNQKGFIAEGDIPKVFKEHCPVAVNFAYVLSFKLDLERQQAMWYNRFLESRELVSEQLKAVSITLKNLVSEVEKEICFNKEQEYLLKENLLAAGIKLKDIIVLETNGKVRSIDVYTERDLGQQVNQMEAVIEEALGYQVNLEARCKQDEGYTYKWKIKNKYRVSAGWAISAKEEISGDVYSFMELDDDQYLLALADGMGSGKLAYSESAATIEMLEDFMDAGFRRDLSVRMINSALILNEKDESFSTIDITLVDRRTGIAEFLKAGAATSFVLHKNTITTIRSTSFPIGMLKEVDLEVKNVQLEEGDIIIMVTDGMLEATGDEVGREETFKHFMLECKGQTPQYMADYLMQKSKDLLGVREGDDMTIIVARIWRDY